jgi:hypothetical protein
MAYTSPTRIKSIRLLGSSPSFSSAKAEPVDIKSLRASFEELQTSINSLYIESSTEFMAVYEESPRAIDKAEASIKDPKSPEIAYDLFSEKVYAIRDGLLYLIRQLEPKLIFENNKAVALRRDLCQALYKLEMLQASKLSLLYSQQIESHKRAGRMAEAAAIRNARLEFDTANELKKWQHEYSLLRDKVLDELACDKKVVLAIQEDEEFYIKTKACEFRIFGEEDIILAPGFAGHMNEVARIIHNIKEEYKKNRLKIITEAKIGRRENPAISKMVEDKIKCMELISRVGMALFTEDAKESFWTIAQKLWVILHIVSQGRKACQIMTSEREDFFNDFIHNCMVLLNPLKTSFETVVHPFDPHKGRGFSTISLTSADEVASFFSSDLVKLRMPVKLATPLKDSVAKKDDTITSLEIKGLV